MVRIKSWLELQVKVTLILAFIFMNWQTIASVQGQ